MSDVSLRFRGYGWVTRAHVCFQRLDRGEKKKKLAMKLE